MEIGPLIKIISHDLRGPLGNLKSVVTLFKSGELEMEQAQQFMQHIEIGVDKSIILLDELIEWGQASTSTKKNAETGVIVDEVVDEVKELLSEQLSNKDLQFESKIGNISNVEFYRYALKLILKNLITNAIKFTERGGHICVQVEESDHEIVFSVIDSGIGVPDTMAEAIFGLSKDNRRIGTEDEKGPGIGLFICRDLAERNSSKLWFEKNPDGKGSVFKFTAQKFE